MAEKYWLDTCIWIDFYENRYSVDGKPLGLYASIAIQRIISKGSKILFSDALVTELKKG